MKNVLLYLKNNVKWLGFFFTTFLFCSGMQAQITVTGNVSDGNGPIPGANVIVKGTSNGAVTDFDGNYTLNNVPADGTLVFSFVGYQAQEIPVNNRTQIDASLENDLESLSEVVVIGYGTQSRESVTGSVVSLKGDELNEVQSANFQQALQGRAAGVQIQTTSTRPGAAPQIRIRGVRSLSGDNNPLIVLNGIPFSGSLNDINVNDISSLDILKDASATAIYGSRGANGVILIETKTGRKGQKARISINSYYATKEVFNKFPMMNAAELTQLRADVAANNGGTPLFAIGGDEDPANDTDWQDLLYGSGMQTSQDFNISGGSEKGSYGFGMGYFKETSVLPGDKFERYSLRANIDQEVGAFRFGLNSIMNFSKASSIVGPNLEASPLLSPYDENGNFLESVRLQTSADQLWIPTRNEINRIGERRTNDQLDFGTYNNIFAEVNIPGIEGLKYRLNIGLNFRNSRDGNFTGEGVFNYNANNPSSASYDTGLTRDYVIENQILYDRVFAEKHKINFVGLFSSQKTQTESAGLAVRNLFSEQFLFYNLDASLAEDITRYGSNYTATGLLSYMGRVLYQYDNRYLFTATLRRDGSSRLAPGYKWVTYPAISLGWNIANEAFMEDVDFINQLKVRAGYGETSNQAIAPYSVQGSLGTRNYNFGNTFATGYFVSQLPNATLGWEFSQTYNYGLDFTLFNNRLSGTVEYYTTKTSDILYTLPLPATSGVGSVRSNIGSTENKGIEISLNGTIIQTPDFTWDAGLNLYSNKNKITSLATGVDSNEGALWFVGKPINVIYDYEKIGLWNESDPDFQYLNDYEPNGKVGMIKVRYTGEFNEDGSPVRAIGPDDRIIIDPTPDFQGGFNTRIAYKNFDLSAVGTFQKGGIVVSTLYSSNGYLNLLTGRRNNVRVDYWTPTNTDAKYPAPGGPQSGDNQDYASTLGYFNGSFLRFRTITLGYNFEQGFLDKLGIQNLRIYATAQNPFVLFSDFKKESGLDPETNSGVNGDGTRQNVAVNTTQISNGIPTIGVNAPTTRNYLLGLNISF